MVVTTLNKVVRESDWLTMELDVHSDPISLVCVCGAGVANTTASLASVWVRAIVRESS